jgi:hypothetical protein
VVVVVPLVGHTPGYASGMVKGYVSDPSRTTGR